MRIILSIALGMVMVFAGGYFAGFQRGMVTASASARQELEIPGIADAEASLFEPKAPEKHEPGAYIDVDSPLASEHAAFADTPSNKPPEVRSPAEPVKTAKETAGAGSVKTVPPVAMMPMASPSSAEPASSTSSVEDHPASPDAVVPGNDAGIENARFTIQVGMYSDAGNAERRVEELKRLSLSAYINQYLNRKNEPRFNVRFGYFSDKRSAVDALAAYQQGDQGSGYVTRYRKQAELDTSKTAEITSDGQVHQTPDI